MAGIRRYLNTPRLHQASVKIIKVDQRSTTIRTSPRGTTLALNSVVDFRFNDTKSRNRLDWYTDACNNYTIN